ncbi:hypothetical protein P8C59_009276 [Phyllachora maydis]|uniref:Cytoplasmic tRNA 2-thiolation protein 1 n=1 Tax=Phyllachora maydis TaxID=1825666 RepID=A0AAD9ICA5_9PEZI|nr:hypothetical protein P8C59_009276 [Phyllachora maydis]
MPLKIIGYEELYGWTMDQVVETIGKRANCTYCGVFRRQALDRGSKLLGIRHLVTGHNADDAAETILMNLLRGDVARLGRSSHIVTGDDKSDVKRSKPLKFAYEKEIVFSGGEMAAMEKELESNEANRDREFDITSRMAGTKDKADTAEIVSAVSGRKGRAKGTHLKQLLGTCERCGSKEQLELERV